MRKMSCAERGEARLASKAAVNRTLYLTIWLTLRRRLQLGVVSAMSPRKDRRLLARAVRSIASRFLGKLPFVRE